MRLIDADALAKTYADYYGENLVGMTYSEYINAVRNAPAIDPVKRGEWNGWTTSAYIGIDDLGDPKYADRKYYRCTLCRYGAAVRSSFCPNCGAKMKGGGEA